MKHQFMILERVNIPSVCMQCWEMIPVNQRDDECVAPVVMGKATEKIEGGDAVMVFITKTGTATVRKARADEEMP